MIALLILTLLFEMPVEKADLEWPVKLTDENIPVLVRYFEEDMGYPYYLLVVENWLAEAKWYPTWSNRDGVSFQLRYGVNEEATDSILSGDLNQDGIVNFEDFALAVKAREVWHQSMVNMN